MTAYFWVTVLGSGTGTWDNSLNLHWGTSSGGVGGVGVPGAGDTVTLDANSCPAGETITVAADINVTSITMGAFTGTLDFSANNNSPTMQTFNCSGTGTRTLNMGNGTWNMTGNATTIWSIATATNLTLVVNSSIVNCTYAGGTGTRTVSCANAAAGTVGATLKISAGTDTFACSGITSFNAGALDFTGFSGTATFVTSNIGGNFTLSSTMTITGAAAVISFAGTSGNTYTITSNGVVIGHPFTFANSNVTWQLVDNLVLATSGSSNNTFTLTNGNFNANGKNVTCGVFSSSNSNTRTLTMGSGTWTLTGNNAVIWNMATTTGLTFNPNTAIVNCTYAGGSGIRTITPGSSATYAVNNLKISAGTDSIQFGGTSTFDSSGYVDFTGFTGTWDLSNSDNTQRYSGNLILGTGMTVTGTTSKTLNFISTTSQTITTNGVTFTANVTLNGVGGTLTLQDNLNMAATANTTLTVTNGTLNANNKNITTGSFSSSNSNTRTITMGSGTWTLTGTGTVWTTATTTGLTLNAGNSTIKITDTTGANTFAGGGMTYYNLYINQTTNANSFTISGSNTFNQIKDDGNVAHSIIFTAGTTSTLLASNPFIVNGEAKGNEITLNSSTNAVFNLVAQAGASIVCNYLNIQHSVATPAFAWFARNSINNQFIETEGSGWVFIMPPVTKSGFFVLLTK